ncbi:MAG TPA: hypothetical protein VF688_07555 [Allosphingosinicella sp.]|jgi:hypothetical protein
MSRRPKSEVVSLEDTRRAKRAVLFLAATMSGANGHSLRRNACPIPGLKYFAGPRVDIAVAADGLPSEREILAWVRNRQTTCMIGRLCRRGEKQLLLIDVYLADGGIVALTGYRLAFSEDRRWLVGGAKDPVALRLRPQGPVPTLEPPFPDEIELVAAKARADEQLAAFLGG